MACRTDTNRDLRTEIKRENPEAASVRSDHTIRVTYDIAKTWKGTSNMLSWGVAWDILPPQRSLKLTLRRVFELMGI